MEFTKTYGKLKGLFSFDKDIFSIEDETGFFRLMPFTSSSSPIPFTRTGIYDGVNGHIFAAEDSIIAENMQFTYPVYFPSSNKKFGKAIVLLHGLNERSWQKYLPWAQFLGERTGRPVILFPLAFHMNRSPASWANPRKMMSLLNSRKMLDGLSMSTFANIALSQRLSDDPLRFFTSGKQSADDLLNLLTDIKDGAVPYLEKGAQIDFFSYSIGSFLAQILFLANPNNLVSSSRLFIFCGGTLFDQMRGTSRLIMDSYAYAALRKYYLKDFLIELKTKSPFSSFVRGGIWGEAFMAMISDENNKFYREFRFQQLKKQLRVVTLKNDAVMPSAAVKNSLACVSNDSIVTELNFPFNYTHENPFPIYTESASTDVDKSFNEVFSIASDFYR
jgi:hypothetical protein